MGYFYRFNAVSKNLVTEIKKCKTVPELIRFCEKNNISVNRDECDENCTHNCENCNMVTDVWCDLYELGNEIFNFGKDDILSVIKENALPLFENDTLNLLYEDYKLYTCNKDAFLSVIKYYESKIIDIYTDLLSEKSRKETDTRSKEERWEEHIRSRFNEWTNEWYRPYQLESGETVVRSSQYEYLIFELVRLYKTFDWDKDELLFLGW